MFGLGPSELIIVAVIILLLFGAKRLPEIGKGVGGAIREFRSVKKELSSSDKEETEQKKEAATAKQNSVEDKVKDKVLEQVPGVKKAVEAKKKAEKIKEIIS